MCGQESSGLSRGPAYQAFDTLGVCFMPSSCSIRTSRGVIQEMIRGSVVILALVHILVLAVGSATGQTSKGGPMAKLTHSLVLLHEQHAAQLRQRSTASFKSNDPLVTLVNDRVVVDVVASRAGEPERVPAISGRLAARR